MKTTHEFAVHVQECNQETGTGGQYNVHATTPLEAIGLAMVEAGLVGHGLGKCVCRVYDAQNDSHFPAGPVLLERETVGN